MIEHNPRKTKGGTDLAAMCAFEKKKQEGFAEYGRMQFQVCGVMIMGYTYASEGTSGNVRIIQYQMVKEKNTF